MKFRHFSDISYFLILRLVLIRLPTREATHIYHVRGMGVKQKEGQYKDENTIRSDHSPPPARTHTHTHTHS